MGRIGVGTVTNSSTPQIAGDEWVYCQKKVANHCLSTYEKEHVLMVPEQSQWISLALSL